MNQEEMKKAKRRQVIGIVTMIILYSAFIIIGIVMAVGSVHCRADRPIYALCAVLSTVMVIICMVYEAKLWKFLKQEGKEHGKLG